MAKDNSVNNIWEHYARFQDEESKKKLIIHYLPLVKATANRIAYGLPKHIRIDDLISAGICGLVSSIEKYNFQSGFKFESYANLRIHGAMLDDLRQMDWVPRSVRANSKKLQEAYNAVHQQKGRFANDSEVAEFMGLSVEEFNNLVDHTKIFRIVSIDARIYPTKNSASYSEIIEDQGRNIPSRNLFKKEQKEMIVQAINELSKQEKIVLTLYYFEELTFREIGEVLNVTESRISQIHAKAILRLRSRLYMSEATDYAPY